MRRTSSYECDIFSNILLPYEWRKGLKKCENWRFHLICASTFSIQTTYEAIQQIYIYWQGMYQEIYKLLSIYCLEMTRRFVFVKYVGLSNYIVNIYRAELWCSPNFPTQKQTSVKLWLFSVVTVRNFGCHNPEITSNVDTKVDFDCDNRSMMSSILMGGWFCEIYWILSFL